MEKNFDTVFYIGKLTATKAIVNEMDFNDEFSKFISDSLKRYISADWGDICEDDAKLNAEAISAGPRVNGRVVGSYPNIDPDKKIWIITDDGSKVTTILFPREY